MNVIVAVAALLSWIGAAHAQQPPSVTAFTGPHGEPCTRITDANHNVTTQCGTGNSAALGSAPAPLSAPVPAPPSGGGALSLPPEWSQGGPAPVPTPPTGGGPMSLPPEWSQGGPSPQPAPPQPPIDLVGKWNYQTVEENLPEDVLIVFQPNGQYNQFIRFPKTPALGKQIVQMWGRYTLQGSTLSVIPAGAQVSNGPKPDQLCNIMNTQRCITPDTAKGAMNFELKKIDDNTLQTPLGIAKRLPQ